MKMRNTQMSKILICVVIIFLFIGGCTERIYYGHLYPIEENGLYGYIDSIGNKVISPQYLYCSDFRQGLALVVVDTIYINGKDSTSYKDNESNPIKDCRYLLIKYGFIDKSGEFMLAPNFVARGRISDTTDFIYDMNSYYDLFSEIMFYDGYACAMDSLTYKYGFINKEGTFVIKPQYEYMAHFSEDKAVCAKDMIRRIYNESRIKYGVIDKQGKALTDFKYSKITDFKTGRAIADFLEPLTWTDILKMGGDISGVDTVLERPQIWNNRTVLLDSNCDTIKSLKSGDTYYGYSLDGICLVRDNFMSNFDMDSFYYINRKGCKLQSLEDLSQWQCDSIAECIKQTMGFIPNDYMFSNATAFSNGYAGVKDSENRWFIVDKYLILRGDEKRNIYESVSLLQHGLIGVKKNGKWGCVDKQLRQIIPCKYDIYDRAMMYLIKVIDYNEEDSTYTEYWINRKDSAVWKDKKKLNTIYKNKYSKSAEKNGKWI